MPRPPKPWWSARDNCWYTQAGGTQRKLVLPDGRTPVPRSDEAGKLAALAEIVGAAPHARKAKSLAAAHLAQRWIDWARLQSRSRRTVASHLSILRGFLMHKHRGKRLGDIPADQIGLAHWSAYQAAMEERGSSPRTIAAHFATVRACWRWAARPVVGRSPSRLLRYDPFRDAALELPPSRRAVRGQLSRADVGKILAAVEASAEGEPFKLAVRAQAESGCRTAEVLGLRWEWWKGRWWEIPPDQHKTGRRTGRARVVAVTAGTAERLERLRAGRAEGWCFKAGVRTGRWEDRPPSPNPYLIAFRRAAAAAGLPECRPYWLRDAFSNNARRAGVAPHAAAQSQGHSAGVAARHYQSVGGEEAAEIVERVAGEG